jgi:hypothetical protein
MYTEVYRASKCLSRRELNLCNFSQGRRVMGTLCKYWTNEKANNFSIIGLRSRILRGIVYLAWNEKKSMNNKRKLLEDKVVVA